MTSIEPWGGRRPSSERPDTNRTCRLDPAGNVLDSYGLPVIKTTGNLRRAATASISASLLLLLAACGSDATTEVDAAGEAETAVGIADRESEVAPAVERMFAFIGANPEVCSEEFSSFNVEYPEDPEDPQVAELDAGIEDRGSALTSCLDEAGEAELSEDISLLTEWGRHLADGGR